MSGSLNDMHIQALIKVYVEHFTLYIQYMYRLHDPNAMSPFSCRARKSKGIKTRFGARPNIGSHGDGPDQLTRYIGLPISFYMVT